jgi:signal transduction histidine kinase
MMRGVMTRQLFAEMKTPLLRALHVLRPHYDEILAAWQTKLHAAGLSDEEIESLASLTLDAQSELLEAVNYDGLQHELERRALGLEGRGLPEAQLIVAMGLYLECCLPHLFAAGAKGKEPALALTRLIGGIESVLLSSYASNREASLRRVQERERHSLSRDLHDDIGHNLLVLKLYLEIMTMDMKKGDVANVEFKLQEALALVSYAVDSVRRLMLDLGPAMLSQFGFLRALRIYARQFTLRTGIDVQVEDSELPEKLASGQETALYRVLQGALSNVLQHSRAKHVKLKIAATRTNLLMTIEDDGAGFDITRVLPQRAFGIMAMRERVELLGGKFHIESSLLRPGSRHHGTRIEIDLPIEEDVGNK